MLAAALLLLATTACAPALPLTQGSSSPSATSVGTEPADEHDWSYLTPPSAKRFTAYLGARHPEFTQGGAVLLWAADSVSTKAPTTMTLPGQGRLVVKIACTDGARVEVAAMADSKRVFWLMSNTCEDRFEFSGEKPFSGALETRLELNSVGGTKYVAAAYFIPDPIS